MSSSKQTMTANNIDIDTKIKRAKYDAIWWAMLGLMINAIMTVAITYAVLLAKSNCDSLIDQWNALIELNKRVKMLEQSGS